MRRKDSVFSEVIKVCRRPRGDFYFREPFDHSSTDKTGNDDSNWIAMIRSQFLAILRIRDYHIM